VVWPPPDLIACVLADTFLLTFPPRVGSLAVQTDQQQVILAADTDLGPHPREINQESRDETPI
jgi:hypothetical protein